MASASSSSTNQARSSPSSTRSSPSSTRMAAVNPEQQTVYRSMLTSDLPVKATLCWPNPRRVKKKLTTRCPLNTVRKILESIDEWGLQKFRSCTQLGKFADLPLNGAKISGELIFYFLSRKIVSNRRNEVWFALGDKPVRFSEEEFCLITGLSFGEGPSEEEINEKIEEIKRTHRKFDDTDSDLPLTLKDKFWPDKLSIKLEEITEKVTEIAEGDVRTKNKAEVCILYLILGFLNPADPKKAVSSDLLLLINDLEFFDRLPWGKICYETLLRSIQEFDLAKKLDAQKNPNDTLTYTVAGCPWIFQIWMYEVIPELGDLMARRLRNPNMPRWFQWKTDESVKSDFTLLSRTDLVARPMLRPTFVEESQQYWILSRHREDDEEHDIISRLESALWGNVELQDSRDGAADSPPPPPARGESPPPGRVESPPPARGESPPPARVELPPPTRVESPPPPPPPPAAPVGPNLEDCLKVYMDKFEELFARHMTTVEAKFESMNAEVQSLKTEVQTMKEEVQSSMNERFDKLEDHIGRINERVVDVEVHAETNAAQPAPEGGGSNYRAESSGYHTDGQMVRKRKRGIAYRSPYVDHRGRPFSKKAPPNFDPFAVPDRRDARV